MVNYTLSNICKEFLIELGESNMNRYAKIYQIAVSILREQNMDLSGTPSTIIIPANTTDSINLPTDCINVIRVAIVDSNGNLQSLGMNDNIALPRYTDDCGNVVKGTPTTNTGILGMNLNTLQGFAENFRNGECMGKMFGVGGGNNAYGNFRWDKQRGTLVFGNLMTNISQVVLEYLSDLSAVGGQYQVHPFLIETLKTGMRYGDIRFNSRIGLGEKQIAKQEYNLAERQSKRRFQSHNMQDYLQAFRLSNKAAPKF